MIKLKKRGQDQVDRGIGGTQPRLLDTGRVLGELGDSKNVIKAVKDFWTLNFQPELVSDRAIAADPLFAKFRVCPGARKGRAGSRLYARASRNYPSRCRPYV